MVVNVLNGFAMNESEKRAYVDYVTKKHGRVPSNLEIAVHGDEVELDYTLEPAPFERIRRITGYLVGTLDRFNNGKRAEERDRVKHTA